MIGKTIKSILYNNNALTTLVPTDHIFPYVMNENTTLPAIVYTIESVSPGYSKGGWENDEITFAVHSFCNDYPTLQTIVAAIRTALEWNRTGSGTQNIQNIRLQSMDEGYDQGSDTFLNRLTFEVIINKY